MNTEVITDNIYKAEFFIRGEYESLYDYTFSDNPLYPYELDDIPTLLDQDSSPAISPYVTASNPYEAMSKIKEILLGIMSGAGYEAWDETLTSMTFDNEETGDIMIIFNIKIIAIH